MSKLSDTPRTDEKEFFAIHVFTNERTPYVSADFARQLERELAHAHKLNGEAVAIQAENAKLERERDQWRKVAEKLESALRKLSWNDEDEPQKSAFIEFDKLKGTP